MLKFCHDVWNVIWNTQCVLEPFSGPMLWHRGSKYSEIKHIPPRTGSPQNSWNWCRHFRSSETMDGFWEFLNYTSKTASPHMIFLVWSGSWVLMIDDRSMMLVCSENSSSLVCSTKYNMYFMGYYAVCMVIF